MSISLKVREYANCGRQNTWVTKDQIWDEMQLKS